MTVPRVMLLYGSSVFTLTTPQASVVYGMVMSDAIFMRRSFFFSICGVCGRCVTTPSWRRCYSTSLKEGDNRILRTLLLMAACCL